MVWTIENVADIMSGLHSSVSERYQAAGYTFSCKFFPNREVPIVFPTTTFKHITPFKAKCRFVL